MFHKIINFILPLFQIMNPESWVYTVFIVLSMNVGTLRPYLILVVILIIAMFFVNRNLINSLWLSFIGVFLLRQSKYFTKSFQAPANYLNLGLRQPEIIYFVAFADAILVLLMYLLIRRKIMKKSSIFKISNPVLLIHLVAILAIGIVATFLSPLPQVSWFNLWYFSKLILIFLLTMIIVQNNKIIIKTLEIIFIYGLFLASLVIIQKVIGGPIGLAIEEQYAQYTVRYADELPSLYRPGGIFWDANLTASILIMMLPSWLIFAFTKKYFSQTFMFICLSIGSLALIFTASRAAWTVGLLLACASYWMVIKKYKISVPKWMSTYGLWGLIILTLAFSPMVLARILSLTEVFGSHGGATYRLRHLEMALHFLKTRPVGLGLGVFQYQILQQWQPQYYLFDSTPAHNIFAQVGAGLGFGGLLLFIRFIYRIIRQGFDLLINQQSSLIKQGIILGCFGYFLASQFYPWWLTRPISGIFWLFLGIFYAQFEKK